jgi:tetratricopeptide (TPR) repeat protein
VSESSPPLVKPRPARTSRTLAVLSGLALLGLVLGGVVYWQTRDHRQIDPLDKALADLEKGDSVAARDLYAGLKSSPDQTTTAALLRGAMLLKKGYHYPALDDLQVAGEDPKHAIRAGCLIGEAWYHLGRQIEAQAAWRKVLDLDPDSVQANRWMAASYYDQGAIHDAIHFLERTAKLAPSDPRPHRLLGLINKDYERYDVAIPCYEESLRRDPHQPAVEEIRFELAACQVKQLKHRDALATLSACADSNEVDVLKAECYYAEGDLVLANQLLASVLRTEPDNRDALVLKGALLLEEGKPADAVATLQRATDKHPMDYLAHFRLQQAYVKSGDEAKAKAEREAAEQIRLLRQEFADLHQEAWSKPNDAGVRLRLASIAQKLNRPDLAEVWLKSANALRPKSAEE